MFRHAYGRSNDTESWGQCNFFFCKSAFLHFCLNKKKIKMLTEIVIVCTGELTGHGFETTGFAAAISKKGTIFSFCSGSSFSPDDPEPQYNKKR